MPCLPRLCACFGLTWGGFLGKFPVENKGKVLIQLLPQDKAGGCRGRRAAERKAACWPSPASGAGGLTQIEGT